MFYIITLSIGILLGMWIQRRNIITQLWLSLQVKLSRFWVNKEVWPHSKPETPIQPTNSISDIKLEPKSEFLVRQNQLIAKNIERSQFLRKKHGITNSIKNPDSMHNSLRSIQGNVNLTNENNVFFSNTSEDIVNCKTLDKVDCMLALNVLGKDFLEVYDSEHNIIVSHKTFGCGSVVNVREAKDLVYLDVDINGEIRTFKSSAFIDEYFNGVFVIKSLAKKYDDHKSLKEARRRSNDEMHRKFKRKAKLCGPSGPSVLSKGNRWKKYGNDTAHAYSQTKGGGKGLHQ
ncbi:hypothetical protein [Vibrio sp. B1Z05]|uniref:hypothetical protein n=1 Tax=Vibrio sp. B1Z05 TaxID=2654980 RepID=UPI00128E5B08|nr:hypothetical protein [Vibrio sp. B1Z05]MPW37294.1 hypothetical protein [Vibrio sp. B1Z05]